MRHGVTRNLNQGGSRTVRASRRSRRATAIGVSLTVLFGAAILPAGATAAVVPVNGYVVAADGSPMGTLSESGLREPEVLFLEDFENNTGAPEVPILLENYVSAVSGVSYTAEPYWLDPKYCNGFITDFNTALNQTAIFNTYCGRNGDPVGAGQGDYMAVRAKALALGEHVGHLDPATNRALSTNTSGGMPTTLMFQTADNNIALSGHTGDTDTRMIALSVDVADTSGEGSPKPEMFFHLLQHIDGALVETPLSSEPIPVGSGNEFDYAALANQDFPEWARKGLVGTHYSKPFPVESGTEIGVKLTNISAASSTGCGAYQVPGCSTEHYGPDNGNDGAIDNIRILDVTPVMDKAFEPAEVFIGSTSTMTLTINNRTDLQEKSGWAFVDTLPGGLQFANNAVSGTCVDSASAGSATVVVDTDMGTLTVEDGVLDTDQESCTITTTVTATEPGIYTNGSPNGNFTDQMYIDGPANATVEFVSGSLSWNKVDADDDSLLAGSEWLLVGPTPDTAVTPTGGWPVGSVTDCDAGTAEDCTGLDRDPVAGQFEVLGLPSGTYTLTETVAPAGYSALPAPLTATITEGNPNAMFSLGGNIANQKLPGSVTWQKVDADDNTQVLAGSEWTLVGPDDSDTEIVVLDCVGTGLPDAEVCGIDSDERAGYFLVEGLDFGAYTLTETKAPAGYRLATDPTTLTATITETDLDVTFGLIENEKLPGSVTWQKVDADDNTQFLAGSEWTLVGPDGQASVVEGPAGTFVVEDLAWGDYRLTETKAPAGYYLAEDPIEFSIGVENGEAFLVHDLGDIVNARRESPALPLTGGLGSDFFAMLGGGVLVFGAGAMVVLHIRKRRQFA